MYIGTLWCSKYGLKTPTLQFILWNTVKYVQMHTKFRMEGEQFISPLKRDDELPLTFMIHNRPDQALHNHYQY